MRRFGLDFMFLGYFSVLVCRFDFIPYVDLKTEFYVSFYIPSLFSIYKIQWTYKTKLINILSTSTVNPLSITVINSSCMFNFQLCFLSPNFVQILFIFF